MKQPEPFGKYLLLGQVAVGGMAEIYKARYADPGMPQNEIALKRILPSYTEDESFVTMFKDEGNIAQRLDHPNIVKVYEVGEVNNDWYIAMEYIRGTDIRILSDACEKYNKRFTVTQIARITCETAKALDYAHKRTDESGAPLNIVHRDCTPHNIMVSQTGEVKLMDFGIAKAASRATKTRVGTVKGKSSYMSPEQARGKQLDGRSDMFTLGTVAWELLTGQRLFKANSDFEILTKVLKAPLIHPSDLDSKVPRDLGDIIMKTLERDRDMRYADCSELARALEDWISVNGDRSDSRLGEVVMCLTNKQGHSFSEIPEYVPGESLYDCVDGEFVKKAVGGGPRSTLAYAPAQPSSPSVAPAPAPVQAPRPMDPYQVSNPYMAAGYPDPSLSSMPAATVKLTTGYIVAYFLIGIAIIASVVLALHYKGLERPEEVVFTPPEATLQLKTRPEGARVLINNEVLKEEDGSPMLTPIFTYKIPLLSDCKIAFEKDDYETVEVERKVVFLTEDVSVDLLSLEEAKKAKQDHFDVFTIRTDPSGANVSVNGKDVGTSPVELDDVKYDETITIEVSGVKGYASETRTITPTRDSEPKIRFTLKEEKAVAVATPTTRTTTTKPKPTAQPAATGPGALTVETTPWSIVAIDGTRVGSNTSVKGKSLKAGSHKIDLTCPLKGNAKVSKTVTIKSGETLKLKYDFNAGKWQ